MCWRSLALDPFTDAAGAAAIARGDRLAAVPHTTRRTWRAQDPTLAIRRAAGGQRRMYVTGAGEAPDQEPSFGGLL